MRVKSVVWLFALAAIVVAIGSYIEAQQQFIVVVPSTHVIGNGSNSFGQLGNGLSVTPSGPVMVVGSQQFTMVDAGQKFSVGLTSTGAVYSWGQNVGNGVPLGLNVTANQLSPRLVPLNTSSPVVQVSAGVDHVLLRTSLGRVLSWGGNGAGQLGRSGNASPALTPLLNVIAVSAGSGFSLALDSFNHVLAWGSNAKLQLGQGGSPTGIVPVPGLSSIVAISAGSTHALALDASGNVWAWGDNSVGQAGAASGSTAPPHQVAGLSNIVEISAGNLLSLARDSNGSVFAFGRADLLGIGTSSQLSHPTPSPVVISTPAVTPLPPAISISAGDMFGVAVLASGQLAGFGYSPVGQAGYALSLPPTTAKFFSGINVPLSSASAGQDHTLMVTGTMPIFGSWSAPPAAACSTNTSATFFLNGFMYSGKGIADVVLALDESGSMDATEFNQLKQFAHNLVAGFDVGPTATRVGVVMFDDDARTLLPLSSDKTQILAAIDGAVQGRGNTCIGCALNQADAELDLAPRAGAGRFIAVVTDGQNNRPSANAATHLALAVTNAQEKDTVITVGLGDGVDTSELIEIASDIPGVPTTLTADFNSLDGVIDALTSTILSPAATNVEVQFDFGPAWQVMSTNSSASGAHFTVGNAGHSGTWELPSLGGQAILNVTLKSLLGGNQPLPLSTTYLDNEGNQSVLHNDIVQIAGCPATLTLAPASSTGLLGQSHTMTATLKDNFGTPLSGRSIRFDVMSGPHFGTLGTATTNASGVAQRSYVGTVAGTDVIEASLASDVTFRSNSASRQWNAPNVQPIAHAGPDQTIVLHNTGSGFAILDGSASTDEQNAPLTYEWASLSGIFAVGGNQAVVTVPVSWGVNFFSLRVFDGQLWSQPDSVLITLVDESAPTVNASVAGTAGQNGWYRSDVALTWDVEDLESQIANAVGCGPSAIVTDTAGQLFTCTATNRENLSTASSITIKRDTVPPTIAAQANISVEATAPLGTPVPFAIPAATDATSGLAQPLAQCSMAPGALFPLGSTVVTCSASDNAGNVAYREFTVTVSDTTPPDVLPVVTGTPGLGTWYRSDVSVTWMVNDPQSGIASSKGCSPLTITTDTTGTTRTCTATNGGGESRAISVTIKRDTTAPVVTTSGNLTAPATSANGAVVNYAAASAVDATSGVPGPVTCAPAAGSTFPIGTNTVTCTASDAAGNEGSSSFTITVSDPTPPVITASVIGTLGNNGWYVGPVQISWTVTDPQSSVSTTGCAPVTVSSETPGVSFTCSATSAGGSASDIETVKVDLTPPMLTTSADVNAGTPNAGGTTVSYGAASATDAMSGVGAPICAPASGSLFAIGTTTVTCTVSDAAGHDASAGFNVIVTLTDSTPPSIVPSVSGTLGSNGWYVGPVQISWTVTDPQSSVSTTGCAPVTVSSETPGVSFTCSATSEGGSASDTQTVKVDLMPPMLTTSAEVNAGTPNAGGTTVSYAAATATDAMSGAGAPTCSPASGSPFAIGTTPVTCTVSDAAGHNASAGFNVILALTDSTPPSIVASVSGTPGSNGWYRSNVVVSWTVTDGESAIGSSTGCAASTISSDTASQTFTCSATSQGGTTTKSVTIKRDTTSPSLTTSGDLGAPATSASGATVNYASAAATDATSGIAGAPACSPASGSTFPIGATTVTCSVSDNAGNPATKSFTVTVTSADDSEAGRMFGDGHVMVGDDRLQFDMSVLERPNGSERGRVDIRLKDGRRGHQGDDRFDARTVSEVTFSNAPDYGPGRNSQTAVDTVVFRGTGKWDRQDGFSYIVTASDRGEPGKNRDTFTIEVRSASGQVVFSGGGTLTNGNIQSTRIKR